MLFASNVYLIQNSVWEQNLTGVRFSAIAFGDLDSDGDTDLILTGCLAAGALRCDSGVIAKVYINNGTTLTENPTWEQNLTAVGHSSLALGDINNDGKLDLVLSGCDDASGITLCEGNKYSKIYINNGTSLVENSAWENNLTNVAIGSFALGDINNDGKLDLILTGNDDFSTYAKIYINNGTSLVENSAWESNLTDVTSSTVSLGDIDNDGKLDLDLAGYDGSSWISKIYINNGTSLVENSVWGTNFGNWGWPENTFGDYNNDGKLDQIRTGTLIGDHFYIMENNGTNFLVNETEATQGSCCLIGFFYGSIAFGDYDNDGNLDIGAMGRDGEGGRDHIYENFYDNISKNPWNVAFDRDSIAVNNITVDIRDGSLAWVDLEGDSDLDLIIIGVSEGLANLVSKVYISNASLTKNNTLPFPPTTFSYDYSDGGLNLSWGNGSDSETPTNGLYYNLMVGNSTNGNSVVSGVYGGSSNPTAGYFGNMMQRKSISLNVDLDNGTYYWYVQTIDTGLAKSAWSARQSFTVGTISDTTPPTTSSVSSSSVTSTTATITWTTNEASNSTVYYGKTTALGSESDSASSTSSHSINLIGLSASTLYYYNVSSCDSSNNCDTSSQRNFTTSASSTVDEDDDDGGGSPGGSTTTSFWTQTYPVSEEEVINGFSKEMAVKQRLRISLNNETHYVGISELTNSTATINVSSEPQIATLLIGEIRRFEVNGDNYYDMNVTLNSIDLTSNKANITVLSIHDEVTNQTLAEEQGKEEIAQEEKKEDIKNKRIFWFYSIIGIIVIFIILMIIFLIKYIKKTKKGDNGEKK